MSFGGNLADYENECMLRGLSVTGSGKNGKIKKIDCIKVLEKWSLDGMRSEGLLLPGCEFIHNSITSPMLAEPQNVFRTPEQFKSFVDRSDVLAEQKMDGCRMILTYHPGTGFELFSRNRSVTNFLFGSYNDQVYGWQRSVTANVLPFSFAIDGEIISLNPTVNGHVVTDTMLNAVVSILGMNQTESYRMQAEADYPLRLEAFDCLMYDGKSVMHECLIERKKILHEVITKLQEAASKLSLPQLNWIEEVKTIRGRYDDKLAYYKQITGAGGEGLILKADGAVYNPNEARGGMGAGFIKWKRTTSETIGGTIDAFVDGRFTPGEGKYTSQIGAIGFSVYLLPSGQVHPIALVSGIPDDLRRSITFHDADGNLCINPTWVGKVAEIEGQDISSKSRSLSHAKILRWRQGADNKSHAECVMQESILNDMIL